MRTMGIGRWALAAFGAVLMISGSAQAQGFRGGGFGMGGYALLSNKSVQQELKLSDDQAEKATKVVEEALAKSRAKSQDLSPEDRRGEKGAEIRRAASDEIKAGVKDLLKTEQTKRLDQIVLQQRGLQAFTDPEIQSKLNLTDDQKSKIKDLAESNRSQMTEIFQNAQGDRQAAMQKMTALRKETQEKTLAILTDSQKKTWKELTGEPFEVKFEPRPNA